MATEKFDKNSRTFETKLLFIKQLFENRYAREEIIGSSIKHKLDGTLKNYTYDLHQSELQLIYENPIKVLKKLNKE